MNNFSLCSLASQSGLLCDISQLPSFDKINTVWKTQINKPKPNESYDDKPTTDTASIRLSPMSKSKKEKRPLPPSFEPGPYSVICGRTQNCYNSSGNRRFRVTVKLFRQDYIQAEGKSEKSHVVSRVLDIIEKASPIGSFVTYENGRWHEVSDRIKREKISSAFRDLLPGRYSSSAKAKQARKATRAKMLEQSQKHQRDFIESSYAFPIVGSRNQASSHPHMESDGFAAYNDPSWQASMPSNGRADQLVTSNCNSYSNAHPLFVVPDQHAV